MTAVNFCAGAFLPDDPPLCDGAAGGIIGGIWLVYGRLSLGLHVGGPLHRVDRGTLGPTAADARCAVLPGRLYVPSRMDPLLSRRAGAGDRCRRLRALFTVQNTPFTGGTSRRICAGEFFALRMLIARSGFPLGALFAAGFTEWMGLSLLFTLLGGIVLTAAASAWFSPVYRELNRAAMGRRRERGG